MSKRFTETGKWDKQWYREMPPEYKAFWQYLCDKCNYAGIWDVDMGVAEFQIGAKLNSELIQKYLGDQLYVFAGGRKWYLTGFIEFQYHAQLNRSSRIHNKIIGILEREEIPEKYFRHFVSEDIRIKDEPPKRKKLIRTVDRKLNPEATVCREYFCKKYKEIRKHEYISQVARDQVLMGRLTARLPLSWILGMIDYFLVWKDEFVIKTGYSTACFYSKVNAMLDIGVQKGEYVKRHEKEMPEDMAKLLSSLSASKELAAGIKK